MIGNDIIDLNLAKEQSNWRRKGYLAKVFTAREQEWIGQSHTPDLLVWTLWSMKEAVYKANFRQNPIYAFAPTKIDCKSLQKNENGFSGEVFYRNSNYFTLTSVKSHFVHTQACEKKSIFANLKIIEMVDYPKNYLEFLKEKEFLGKNQVILKDEKGIPSLSDSQEKKLFPVSIAHHGRFLGVIWSLDFFL